MRTASTGRGAPGAATGDEKDGALRFAIQRCVLSQLAHVDVDIEIDVADAGLRGAVRATLVPSSAAYADILTLASRRHRHCGSLPLLSPANCHANTASSPALLVPMMCGHNSRWRPS